MKVSIIITTYNWPEALKVVLLSILQQTVSDYEVIIADDGSSIETENMIQNTLEKSMQRWVHVRHNDNGIRQARIKNLAVKHAQNDYFIFIDHDVPLHPKFIHDHMVNAKKGFFLQGKRVFLPESLTTDILQSGQIPKISPWLMGLENRKNAFRLPRLGRMLSIPKRFQTSLRGCNLSMHKNDFMTVDGYDEVFDQAWGREDSDICYRLFHQGIQSKNLWFSGIQYHLHHHVLKKRDRDILDEELELIIQEKRNKAKIGFSKLSDEGNIINQSR